MQRKRMYLLLALAALVAALSGVNEPPPPEWF